MPIKICKEILIIIIQTIFIEIMIIVMFVLVVCVSIEETTILIIKLYLKDLNFSKVLLIKDLIKTTLKLTMNQELLNFIVKKLPKFILKN